MAILGLKFAAKIMIMIIIIIIILIIIIIIRRRKRRCGSAENTDRKIGVQPDLKVRRQRLAARSLQMVSAKPLGQLMQTGVVASFVTLARHDSKSGGTQSPPIQYGR